MESLNEHGIFAGAIRGPHGYWAPKRSFWVYDDAFLTAGANFVDVAPASKNGKSCATSYDAIRDFLTDFDPNRYMFAAATEVTRQDNNGNAIGTWAVGDGKVGCPKLCNMRHFAAIKAGRFRLQFSDPSGGQRVPKRFEATLGNLLSKDD